MIDLQRAADDVRRLSKSRSGDAREQLARYAGELEAEAKTKRARARWLWGALCLAALLLWALPSPAQAQMNARCALFPSGPNIQVEATSTEQNFDIVVRGGRCLMFIRQVESPMFPGKRAGWLIDGKDGDILAEFWGKANNGQPWEPTDIGLCSFRGGRFKTAMCSWSEWMARSAQM